MNVSVPACVCLCLCVCVREREIERKREREQENVFASEAFRFGKIFRNDLSSFSSEGPKGLVDHGLDLEVEVKVESEILPRSRLRWKIPSEK